MTEPVPSHLGLDQLADVLAGEPHEHLPGCADCTSRLAELAAAEAGVVAALQALPDPAVPADLAARLSAVFAAEPPIVDTAPADTAPGGTAPVDTARSAVTSLPAAAPRRRFLPAAAAAILIVSGGGLGYALVTGSTSGNDSTSTDTGSEATADAGGGLVQNASGTDYADTAAVTGALPGVLAGTASPAAADSAGGATGAQSDQQAPAAPPPDQSRSSTELQAPAGATTMSVEDPLARLRTPAGLEDCLTAVLPPEEPGLRPLALDYATYQGRPALAVVLPDPDPAKLSVFVVGADCAAADAKVLGFLRVDAP